MREPVNCCRNCSGSTSKPGSIGRFVTTCHQQLAEVETSLKAALVKTKVIQKARDGIARRQNGVVGPRVLDRSAHPLRRSSQSRSPRPGCAPALHHSFVAPVFMMG